MHADERQFWESGSGKPQQREDFLESIKERWRKTPVRKIPFNNPTEEHLRRSRITQAIHSGQRPDPDDLAEEEEDKTRYQRKVFEAFEKKRKELYPPEQDPQPPSESSKLPARDNLAVIPESNILDLPEEPKKSESLWDKFWRLTESNFFMGGGVGMALAAYAFLIGGAPKFAIFLLVIAWLVITVSTYRHNFFEDKSRPTQLIGQTLVSLAVAVVLFLLWFILLPKAPVGGNAIVLPQPMPMPSVVPSPISQPVKAQALPTPMPAPSPSPSALKSPRKRSKTLQQTPCNAEDRLLGKC